MQESSSSVPAEGVAAYVGIDWADQKHDVILRAASEPAKVEYRRIAHKPDALMEWLGELQQRFAGKGKILVCLEQSREIKSQLKVYFPLALQTLDNDTRTALAADLLLQWPTLDLLQKQSAHKLRKFFYAVLAQSFCAKAFMSLPLAPSVTALGPKPVTKLRSTAAKGTTPLCGRCPSNGSGSCSPVGNTAYPTTPNDINKPSEPVVQTTLRAALS